MARILSTEKDGAKTEQYHLHVGEDGKDRITITSTMDVEPVFGSVKDQAQNRGSKDFLFKATIDENTVTRMAQASAKLWGCSVKDAFAEFMNGKTDRAKKAWKILTEDREYRKFQAKAYR